MRSQTFRDWQWCIVDDCSTRPEIIEALDALDDPRIVVHHRRENGGIVAASNDGVALATGELIALLDHDDRVLPHAFADVLAVFDGRDGAEVDYVYTDEAHVAADGGGAMPFPKPAWSPERFRASMYTCHLSVMRRAAVEAIGGFRVGFDGSQDHDLILRLTEHATAAGRRVVHLPVMTYHWRTITSSVSRASASLQRAVDNGRRAVQEQCDRVGIDATVEHGPVAGTYRLVRRLPADTTVTVAVVTTLAGTLQRPFRLDVQATVERLRTDHPGATLTIAYPHDARPEQIELLASIADQRWQLVPVPGTWAIGAALDRALLMHPADVLVSVAAGMVPRSDLTPDWLEVLAAHALEPGVGMVGGLIANTTDRVVHAGWDAPDFRNYLLEDLTVGSASAGNDLLIERECDLVSLAAAAISGAHWREFRSSLANDGWHLSGKRISAAALGAGAQTRWTPYARFDQVVATTF